MKNEKELAEILLKAIKDIPYDKQIELIESVLEGEFNRGYYTRDLHYRTQQGVNYIGHEFNPIKIIEKSKLSDGEIQC